MKKLNNLSAAIGIALVLVFGVSNAQAQWNTTGGNNITLSTEYLGTDGSSTSPLQLRTIETGGNSLPIDFFTNTDRRMRINAGNATFTGIGGSAPTPGFVGIGVSPTDIRSRLTITGENNSGAFPGGGFRTWMKTGVFTLENSDNMYVGMKEEGGTDRSDAVVAWSDNASGTGAIDKLRFIFTGSANIGGNNSNPRSIASFNGYEFMRMTPFPGLTNSAGSPVGNIGIGPVFNDNNLPQNWNSKQKVDKNLLALSCIF